MSKINFNTTFNDREITEEEAISLIEKNKNNIYKMKHPSTEVILLALSSDNKELIHYVDDIVENIIYNNIESNPEAIHCAENPSEDLQLACVEINPNVIGYIEKPSEKVQIEAVKQSWETIELFEPSIETVYEATRQNTYVINRFDLNAFSQNQLIDILSIVEDQELNMFFKSNFYDYDKDQLIEEIEEMM